MCKSTEMCLDLGYLFRQAGDLQKEWNRTNLLSQICYIAFWQFKWEKGLQKSDDRW